MHRVALALALLLLWPASASAKTITCRSGHTLWSHARARVFEIDKDTEDKTIERLYLCSPAIHRPFQFDDNVYDPTDFSTFRGHGRYVSFIGNWEDGTDAGWDAQWVDLATGEERQTPGADTDGRGLDEYGEGQAVAVDADGSVAVLEAGAEHKAVIGWALNGVYRLHRMQTVASLDEPVLPGSLGFVDGVVSWTTTSGVAGGMRVR